MPSEKETIWKKLSTPFVPVISIGNISFTWDGKTMALNDEYYILAEAFDIATATPLEKNK